MHDSMREKFAIISAVGGFFVLILGPVLASPARLDPVELDRLHAIATKCDRDNSGVPDIDTCVPVYDKLIRYYGSYPAFVAAVRERQARARK